jgi:hypothetical protein
MPLRLGDWGPPTTPAFGQCAISTGITTNQAAIRALIRVINQYVGNLPPMPSVFPDYLGAGSRNESAMPSTHLSHGFGSSS